MTMPQKPSPQATNKLQQHTTKLAWYRVPVVWLGVLLTLLVIVGLVHMAYVSHQSVKNTAEIPATTEQSKKTISHFRGMPLRRSQQPKAEPNTPSAQHD